MADYVIKYNKLTPLGRAFQQYYRFLLPGTLMIKAASDDNDLLIVAGKRNNDLVIIIINNSDQDKSIDLEGDGLPPEFKMFRTSSAENFKQLPNTTATNITMKAKSITSLASGNLPTKAENELSDSEISIYPNPARENLLVRNASGCHYTLHDFQGRCLLSGILTDQEQKIELNNMPSGVYMVTITGNDRRASQKLTIINQ
jgi:hypothetical protein